MVSICKRILPLFLVAMLGVPSHARAESGDFHLGVYGGKAAKERMLDILTRYNTGFIDSYLVAIAPGYVFRRGPNTRHEVEGQVVYHWGEQNHWEFNVAYLLRWMTFPWDQYVDTRVAVGAGVSWATEVPFIEPRAKELGEQESTQLLGYVAVEIELAPPRESAWSGFIRLHHRSSAYGLFDDTRGGSNFITLGTRYHF